MVASFSPAQPPDAGPNAPLPARKKEREIPRALVPDQFGQPVGLKDLKVHRLEKARGPALVRLAGIRFLEKARDPIEIQVTLTKPLTPSPRDTAPIIVLNGVRLTGTRVPLDRRDRLIAFIPDTSLLKEDNTLTVIWVGNEDLIQTKEPFHFKLKDIK